MTELATIGQFGVIYADPPWGYRDLGHTRRIDRQYSIMRTADIAALPVYCRSVRFLHSRNLGIASH